MSRPIIVPNGYIHEEISDERARQQRLRAEGKFTHSPSDADMPDAERLAILVEEVGEAAEAVIERLGYIGKPKGTDLRKELIQVAAVAVAWIEALDKKEGVG